MEKDDVLLTLGELKGLIQGSAQESRDRAERAERNANERHAKLERRVDVLTEEVAKVKVQSQTAQDDAHGVSQALGRHMEKDEETAQSLDLRMSNIELAVGVVSDHTVDQNVVLSTQTRMLKRIDKTAVLVAVCSTVGVIMAAYFSYRAAVVGGEVQKPQSPATHQSP